MKTFNVDKHMTSKHFFICIHTIRDIAEFVKIIFYVFYKSLVYFALKLEGGRFFFQPYFTRVKNSSNNERGKNVSCLYLSKYVVISNVEYT